MSASAPDASKDADRGIDTEQDVPVDDATAASRATGGSADAEGPDSQGTTGTGESGEFVGRVSGQDEGYAGVTGAEVRGAAADAAAADDGGDDADGAAPA